jgi:plasmid maintenance system killer protein
MLSALEASSALCKLMKLFFVDAYRGKNERMHSISLASQRSIIVEWKNDTRRESNYVIYMLREE